MPRPKRIWKRLAIFLICLLVIAGMVTYAYIKPLPAITATVRPLAGQSATTVNLPWPSYGEAAVGAVGYGVLTTHGDQTALPTASIAKVMTALAVLKQKPLNVGEQGPTIVMTQTDVDAYNKYVAEDGSVVKVNVGDQFTEYQALQALLLPSANNLAETLARWAFGSIDNYNSYANQYAAAQGMTATHITDPSGFLPSTTASAHDLTLLGIAAIQNPVIADIVSQSTATLPNVGAVANVNKLLGQNGTVGIKTGNSDQDLGAYLFASNQTIGGKAITLFGTIMNGPDLGTALHDSLPLITSATGDFTSADVVHVGDTVGSYRVAWQGTVNAVAQKDINLTSWKGTAVKITPILQKLPAQPIASGSTVGTVTVQNGLDHSTNSSSVQLAHAIKQPSFFWRLKHIF